MRITTVVDNQAGPGLEAEHGLSFLIETRDKRILFDTGQGPSIETNAPKLGIDLSTIDAVVLSHGHYDHTGGVAHVLGAAPAAEVYCHPRVFTPRYSIEKGKARSVGLPPECAMALDRLSPRRLHWVSGKLQLSDELAITGPIPRENTFEDVGGPFFLSPDGKIPDLLEDDMALWMETDDGVVIVVGCCHAGIVNTINHVFLLGGSTRLRAVIGGLHLVNADDLRLEETISALKSFSPELVVPCHCTGEKAVEALKSAMGERVSPGRSGSVYDF